MEVLGATAGHDGNRRAGAAPVLRLEVGGLDADLGDRVERRRGVVAGVRPGVLAGHAVVRKVETAAAAVDRQAAHAVPARRLAVGRIHDARQELQVAGEVAALQGDVVDLLAVDEAGTRRVGRLHERGLRLDGDLLAQLPDFQRDRAKCEALGRAQLQALLFVDLEALHGHLDVVGAGQEVGKLENAIGARDRVAGEVGTGVGDGDRGAWHHAATRVGDSAGDLSREPLRMDPRECAGRRHQHECCGYEPAETVVHVLLLSKTPS